MANFTPQEIEEMLQEFFDVVGKRQYIGARYVPIFGRKDETSIEWDNTKPYEPLTIVLYQGNSFTSRQYVPTGVDISNTDFWANTGNYNAQVESYRSEVANYADIVEDYLIVPRVRCFDTVNDMKNDATLNVGETCITNAFRSATKNGGGSYTIIADDSNCDEMFKIKTFNGAAILNCNTPIKPETIGAYGDGTHDDSTYIQALIDAVKSTGIKINFSQKFYGISRPIYLLTNSDSITPLSVDFCGAHLKAINSVNAILICDTAKTGDLSDNSSAYRLFENVYIECEEKATYGIYHIWGRGTTYSNVAIMNPISAAIKAEGHIIIDGCFIDRRMYNYQSTGIILNMTDNKIRNVRMRDMHIGVSLVGSASTFLDNVHCWLINESVIDSVCFDVGSSEHHFVNCYADTYETSWKWRDGITAPCFFDDCMVYWNPQFYNTDITTVAPIVFSFNNELTMNNQKFNNLNISNDALTNQTGMRAKFADDIYAFTVDFNFVQRNRPLNTNLDNRPSNYVNSLRILAAEQDYLVPFQNYATPVVTEIEIVDELQSDITVVDAIKATNYGTFVVVSGRITIVNDIVGSVAITKASTPFPTPREHLSFSQFQASGFSDLKPPATMTIDSSSRRMSVFGGSTLYAGKSYIFNEIYAV